MGKVRLFTTTLNLGVTFAEHATMSGDKMTNNPQEWLDNIHQTLQDEIDRLIMMGVVEYDKYLDELAEGECFCRPETQYGLFGEACDFCKSQNSDEIPF